MLLLSLTLQRLSHLRSISRGDAEELAGTFVARLHHDAARRVRVANPNPNPHPNPQDLHSQGWLYFSNIRSNPDDDRRASAVNFLLRPRSQLFRVWGDPDRGVEERPRPRPVGVGGTPTRWIKTQGLIKTDCAHVQRQCSLIESIFLKLNTTPHASSCYAPHRE